MKPTESKTYLRLMKRKTLIASAIRHILIASLGASFSVGAQEGSDITVASPQDSGSKNVRFNSDFIHGVSVDVSRYSQGNPNPAGDFVVQVAVNGDSRGQHTVSFVSPTEGASAQPCFTYQQLVKLGVKVSQEPTTLVGSEAKAQCAPIEQWVPEGARADYLAGDFYLNLVIPQAYTVQYPRGYTDPNAWQSGVSMGMLDYNANIYAQQSTERFRGNDGHQVSGNLGILAGVNMYGWRLRKRINTNWTRNESTHTQNLFTYVQRDIPALKSQLTLGDSTTSGYLFDSLSIRGIQLQSDDRMLPDGLRYYTPLLRGIAETNARVRVTQRGQTIYETTVPAGPFELSDIGAMGYGGDLLMTIMEADGRIRTQSIPYSAPPMLLREGISRFGVTVGKLRDDSLRERPGVAQGFYQYGLGNMYTLYGGGQLSDGYTALGIGHAFNTPVGGISMDATHARSELGQGRSSSGNSYNIGFSKYLDSTNTDVTLAAYRYSSKGFYSFRDASIARYGSREDHFMVDYRTRERFSVNIGQPLWDSARITFSGNFYNYWDSRSSSSQYMLTYNKSERYFTWSVAAARAFNSDGRDVNSVMFTISVPLGHSTIVEKPLFNTFYSSVSHDNDGASSVQMNAIGSQGEQNELSYGIGASVNKVRNDSAQSVFTGNVNYNSSWGQFGSTASVGSRSRQISFTGNGSLVAHSGGLTLGPRLGDLPFALVNAPGAEGAKMLNGYGSRIDGNGYAIMPSLSPYHENTIALDTAGLPDTVDVLENENTVIPRMGAAIRVNIKTLVGAPVVLIVRDGQNNYLPIGADVVDERNVSLGIIGQSGMAFVRGWKADKENLYVRNAAGDRLCTIYSDSSLISKINQASGSVIQVGVVCH